MADMNKTDERHCVCFGSSGLTASTHCPLGSDRDHCDLCGKPIRQSDEEADQSAQASDVVEAVAWAITKASPGWVDQDDDTEWKDNELLARKVIAAYLSAQPKAPASDPIDMILHCPACGLQHIDAPDERTPDWSNPAHRSHLCHGCGHIWRPADVPTNGVAAIQTKGKNDSPPPAPVKGPVSGEVREVVERLEVIETDDVDTVRRASALITRQAERIQQLEAANSELVSNVGALWKRREKVVIAKAVEAALSQSPADEVAVTEDVVRAALQGAWDDWCADAEAYPGCFTYKHGRLSADFNREPNFIHAITLHLNSTFKSPPQEVCAECGGDGIAYLKHCSCCNGTGKTQG